MPYTSSGILCRKCLTQDVDEQSLRAHLDGYAASLPEEIRTPEAEYVRRLFICEGCPHRIQFTCTQCGCYIQARAAKRMLKCPLPGAPRWTAIEPDENEMADLKGTNT